MKLFLHRKISCTATTLGWMQLVIETAIRCNFFFISEYNFYSHHPFISERQMTDDDDKSVDEKQWKSLYSISNENCVIFLISDVFFLFVCFLSTYYWVIFLWFVHVQITHKLHRKKVLKFKLKIDIVLVRK